jgi:recombination protein RecR
MAKLPTHLSTLIALLKKLPGVGSRTAERFAFHLSEWPEADIENFSSHIRFVKEKTKSCPDCRCLMDVERCLFCHSPSRDTHQMCIVSSAKDVFSLEDTGAYRGLYHVIGALLSPLERRGPQSLDLEKLMERILKLGVKEVVIALDSTIEGDATALYLKQQLEKIEGVHVSRLAHGIPLNSTLDFIDGGTLVKALTGRQTL